MFDEFLKHGCKLQETATGAQIYTRDWSLTVAEGKVHVTGINVPRNVHDLKQLANWLFKDRVTHATRNFCLAGE